MYKNKQGVALIVVYLVIVTLVIWGLAFLSRSISEQHIAEQEKDSIKALYIAEAGIEDVKKNLYDAFEDYFNDNGRTSSLFSWFDTLPDEEQYDLPEDEELEDGSYTVTIDNVDVISDGRDVTLTSTGIVDNVRRSISVVLRFGLGQSPVFNYSYFVNNLGWFYGGGITSNGDIRSNGNFSFQGNPEVNGDIYSSGTISGSNKNDTLPQYRSQEPVEARPTNPTNPLDPEGTEYELGYDGNSQRFADEDELDMPYLGNLTTYKSLAYSEGGTLSQGGVTLINAVYDGNGPDGNPGTPDDGSLVLVGTAANPIEIDGPVVIENDVVIKGVISGQGTIYTGRNVHIAGNIIYADGPEWSKPDSDPDATEQTNSTKDFLGLAAKGNIIVGDYTRQDWRSNVSYYISSAFTDPYAVDETDSDIGYVSYYQDDDPYFHGDYTVNDGGYKDNGYGGSTSRKYYESSLSDSTISSVCDPSSSIRTVEAVTYTNHAWAGKVGEFSVNGSIISRDEAVVASGSIKMNYDVRAWGGADALDIYLPRDLARPEILSWEE